MKITGWEGRLIPKSIVINAFFREEKDAIEEAENVVVETESLLTDLIESAEEESALADVSENGKVKAKDIEAKIDELTSTIETEETIELEVIRMGLHLVNTKKRLEAYLLGHPLCKSAVNENGKITKASIEYRLRIIRTEESVPESLQEHFATMHLPALPGRNAWSSPMCALRNMIPPFPTSWWPSIR